MYLKKDGHYVSRSVEGDLKFSRLLKKGEVILPTDTLLENGEDKPERNRQVIGMDNQDREYLGMN